MHISLDVLKVNTWYRKITTPLFHIHSTFWNECCSSIYNPPLKEIFSPAKEYLLKLVQKYYSLRTDLPKSKQKWLSRKINQYKKLSVPELLKWIWISRRLIQKHHQSKNNATQLPLTNTKKTTVKKSCDYFIILLFRKYR